MDWIKILIGAAVVVGWIVNAVLEQQKQAKNAERPKPPPLPSTPDAPAPQSADALNDFLRELRRRKKEAEAMGAPAEEPIPAILVEERPKPPPPLPPTPAPRPAARPPLVAPAPAASPMPVMPEMILATSMDKAALAAPTLVSSRTTTSTTAAASSVAGIATVMRRTPSPAVARVLEMLRQPQQLPSFVVVREILDEPLSRRRAGPSIRTRRPRPAT